MITRISLGLAVAMALPLAAQAHDDALPTSAVSAQPDAIVVVRDAQTGRLRAATPEEHEALMALKPSAKFRVAARAAAVTPMLKQHSSGAVGVRLTEDMMSHSVMVRGADGKLEEVCFASKEEAEAFIKSGAKLAKSTTLPTE